ncbi:MAG TPA: hypothetical protein V6D30_10210 [Leptolyngbyaceae cyanobacterium]
MPYEPDEMLAELGYALVRSRLERCQGQSRLSLPKATKPFERAPTKSAISSLFNASVWWVTSLWLRLALLYTIFLS